MEDESARRERARIVAWMRARADHLRQYAVGDRPYTQGMIDGITHTADAIESGRESLGTPNAAAARKLRRRVAAEVG